MYTLNNILQQCELFQQNHKQINSFYFGKLPDLAGASREEIYPMLFMALKPDSGDVNVNTEGFFFDFAIVDQPNKNGKERNEQEVLSDTKQMAKDLVAFLNYTRFDPPIKLDLPVSMQSGTEMWDDDVSGWMGGLNIRTIQGLDLCSVPMEGYTPPEDYNKVRIIDKDTHEVLYRISAPGEFTIEQLRAVIDTIDSNETAIIDPII